MNFLGTWRVVGLPDRELVFADNGMGYFSTQGERMPFFQWSITECGRLAWQFFLNEALTEFASCAHEPEYAVSCGGTELRFEHAPFPFGIKHFVREAQPDA
ncbi:hypothetical protein [Jeongeupia naejangsanensis]|uniref:Lipocalin-like domain-containing protein n=1 Tax=Jeongeupia naejangsanensis TaxID=613195 RepID=A0ABS2BKD1_9NEIS|nr:hypothetical protein [Jeongeupia naejangsanensis]MBM3116064.1 hypothetical protein [Jeongeupia naejangsanensis]